MGPSHNPVDHLSNWCSNPDLAYCIFCEMFDAPERTQVTGKPERLESISGEPSTLAWSQAGINPCTPRLIHVNMPHSAIRTLLFCFYRRFGSNHSIRPNSSSVEALTRSRTKQEQANAEAQKGDISKEVCKTGVCLDTA